MAVLLLTGASGLVGGELLRRFVAAAAGPDPAISCIALCRQSKPTTPVATVAGDLRRPYLGLDAQTYRGLQQQVTEILHCAADTRFGLELEAARQVNTLGTDRLLEFARGCRRLEKLAYISTVYVAGDRTGAIDEEFGPLPARFFNTYQQSKYEAEELVNRAARELPVMVLRLSSIAGDSATGEVRRFTYVHQVIRLFPRNILQVAPVDPEAPLDLIPTDYAAGALLHIFRHGFTPGMTCQVCAGPQHSLSLRKLLELTLATFSTHPAGRRFLPIQAPEFVTLAEYERYAREQTAGGSALLRQVLRGVGHFLPHLALRQEFQNQNAQGALKGSGLTLPPVAEYFPKVVAYCLVGPGFSRAAPLKPV